jgi:hypothetical protein
MSCWDDIIVEKVVEERDKISGRRIGIYRSDYVRKVCVYDRE